jgi:hypothetical protein
MRVGAALPRPGSEIVGAAFFARDGLPELSKGRVIERGIEAAFVFLEKPGPVAVD